ncbi:YdiU family protein [Ahrensia kielensis]|uniref:Protein nucleotidyltransferase YdiU n=1 Tax=Ahrensia kielensis TaxID=76980 RepID=A0ABU9T1Y1_9HYPH
MTAAPINFDNSYAKLPEGFYAKVTPAKASAPEVLALNESLAKELGIDTHWLKSDAGIAMLSGNALPEGAASISTAYAGHQFGNFVPQLGDGRALLIGEVIDTNGKRRDIQLKGSGLTPFSRGGDGKAAIGPVLREYIVSEAMHALGITTTRALAALVTGDEVIREEVLPGAILTRVASSHIRVGTFQFFYARDDVASLKALADHVIERHYPEARNHENPYLAMLQGVVEKQAKLIADWLMVGFIHGVMNTDNMSIAGETIDYGPCAFMDRFDPKTVFSAIDQGGRYAYGNQPSIGQWNLSALAQAMLPILDDDEAKAIEYAKKALDAYSTTFETAYETLIRKKLGFQKANEGDVALWQDLTKHLTASEVDFTQFFRALSKASIEPSMKDMVFHELFGGPSMFDMWMVAYRLRLHLEDRDDQERQKAMLSVNPAYIPRNHLVNEALEAAQEGDLTFAEKLMEVLSNPFEEQAGFERYLLPPKPEEVIKNTFCGT